MRLPDVSFIVEDAYDDYMRLPDVYSRLCCSYRFYRFKNTRADTIEAQRKFRLPPRKPEAPCVCQTYDP